jgi:long-subunit fatty acid transport protein
VDTSVRTATATQEGNDTGWGMSGGILWQVRPPVRVGAVYRRGPRFSFEQDDRRPLRDPLVRRGSFKVPDVFGTGVFWRPAATVTISADYARVFYSQLLRDFIEFQAISSGRERQLSIRDGHEWHLGAEWVVTREAPQPTVRAGVWYDPDHAVRYVPDGIDPDLDIRLTAILPGGENLVHYTVGGGVSLSERFELSVAADITSRSTYLSMSGIVRLFRRGGRDREN